ncbi:hypothetical protein BD413DRAFT_472822, partial [Trametes elegans]
SMSLQDQAQTCTGIEEGGIYVLRHTNTQITLCLDADQGNERAKAASGRALRQGPQKVSSKLCGWCVTRMGLGWVLRDLETGLFLGVEERSVGARAVATTFPTAWRVVPNEQDRTSVRLTLLAKGHALGPDDEDQPRLNAMNSLSLSYTGEPKREAWDLVKCGHLYVYPLDERLSCGSTGWVSGLLCLPSA